MHSHGDNATRPGTAAIACSAKTPSFPAIPLITGFRAVPSTGTHPSEPGVSATGTASGPHGYDAGQDARRIDPT
ncbi:hypothetical protein Ssi03_16000 [Sphaerisporangium siamense]|nr:hypothetical protein Ssi03_16000 [Sphaerisporangium siamense]